MASSTGSSGPARPSVFVVTGPSGAGKGTLIRALLPDFPEIEVATLMGGLMSLTENPGAGTGSAIAGGITDTFGAINTGIGKVTGGLDPKLLVPVALIFLGLRGLWTSEKFISPSWSNLLWFGFASFVMLNRGLVEGSSGTIAEEKI